MVRTEQIGPRIDRELKECFSRHVDRVESTLGGEVDKALRCWLAVYYLNNEDARDDIPKEDREFVEKTIAKQTYEIEGACERLDEARASTGNAQASKKAPQDHLDDIIDEAEPDDLRQIIKDVVHNNAK